MPDIHAVFTAFFAAFVSLKNRGLHVLRPIAGLKALVKSLACDKDQSLLSTQDDRRIPDN